MGDRAVIALRQSSFDGSETLGYLHLYTHWDGAGWAPAALKAALKARPRWGDEVYATRILLTELIGNLSGPTGYGVSIYPLETEHPVLVLDLNQNRAWTITRSEYESGGMDPIDEPVSIDEMATYWMVKQL